jgi:magnesium transporter
MEIFENKELKWYDISDPSQTDMKFIKDNFNFHPLDLDDLLSKTQRPKIDIYDDYYFMILHFPFFEKNDPILKIREIKIFWGKDYLITISNSKLLSEIIKRNQCMPKNSDLILYNIIEQLLRHSFSILSSIGEKVESINDELFDRKPVDTIERISNIRRNIINLDTIFRPQLRLFRMIESGTIKGFSDDMEDYWGNTLDSYNKIWDIIEDSEEIIDGLSKTFDSLQTNRTNEIMKALTLISSILLPLTLIASIYGMNIPLPFQGEPHAYWGISGGMIVIISGFILYFKRKKWM